MEAVTNKDLALISKIVESKDFITPKRKGIRVDMLEGPGRKLWEFIDDYYSKYQSVPSFDTVNNLLAESKTKLWHINEPMEFLCEDIIRRDTFEQLKKFQYDLDKWMNDEKPEDVVGHINGFLRKNNERALSDLNIVYAKDVIPEIIDSYKATELGIMGIKTLCPTMDDATGGWGDGDLSFFVARTGLGKSWSLVLTTHAALKQGKTVLLISGEMSMRDMIYRHLALDFKIPYAALRKAKLDGVNKKNYERALIEYQQSKTLRVIDASGGVNTAAIEAAIDQTKPDLVCLDAVYRIKAPIKSKDRFENLALVTSELKSICGRQKVPIIGSTQLNRDSTKKKDGDFGTDDLAMSDVLGWESSNIFALFQSEEHKNTNRMGFKAVKVREMEKAAKPIIINWDFVNMNFTEADEFHVHVNPIDQF